MTMRKIQVILLILAMIANGCSKSGDSCKLDNMSILGGYVFTSYTIKSTTSSTVIDVLALLKPCERDNILNFNSNGTTTATEAGISCNPPTTSTNSGTWSFSGDKLVIDGTAFSASFDCSTLTLKGESGTDILLATLKKQ